MGQLRFIAKPKRNKKRKKTFIAVKLEINAYCCLDQYKLKKIIHFFNIDRNILASNSCLHNYIYSVA